jgi:hypothetical protein
MTKANQATAHPSHCSAGTVYLRPGEGLWQAKRRWETAGGRRGLVVIRA